MECFFNKIKNFRRIFARFDKMASLLCRAPSLRLMHQLVKIGAQNLGARYQNLTSDNISQKEVTNHLLDGLTLPMNCGLPRTLQMLAKTSFLMSLRGAESDMVIHIAFDPKEVLPQKHKKLFLTRV